MQTKEEKKKRKAEYHQRVMAEKRKKRDEWRRERISRSLLDNTDYWHKIPGYEDKYRINKRGNIFRTTDMKFVIPCLNDKGYWRINLNKRGKILQHYLHRVMCEVFIGKLNKGDTVAFKDRNEKICRLSNLVLVEKGSGAYHTHRTTKEAEERILSRGKLASIVLWLSHDGEYHDQRTPFVAKCFNNHTIIGNYWDYGGMEPPTGCKYCSRGYAQTQAEMESMLYDSGLVKEVLYFETPDGKYHGPTDRVAYLCFNDHLNIKPSSTQMHLRAGCRFCNHRVWKGLSKDGDVRFNDNDLACHLYICEFSNGGEEFYKIGITRHGVGARFNGKIRGNLYTYEVLLDIVLGSHDAYKIEQSILSYINTLGWKYTPEQRFGGDSECFRKDRYHQVLEEIEKMIVQKLLGEDNPASKLSEEAARFIKTSCKPGDSVLGVNNLARMFRVHPKTVYNVVNGRTWKSAVPYLDVSRNY